MVSGVKRSQRLAEGNRVFGAARGVTAIDPAQWRAPNEPIGGAFRVHRKPRRGVGPADLRMSKNGTRGRGAVGLRSRQCRPPVMKNTTGVPGVGGGSERSAISGWRADRGDAECSHGRLLDWSEDAGDCWASEDRVSSPGTSGRSRSRVVRGRSVCRHRGRRSGAYCAAGVRRWDPGRGPGGRGGR